MEDDLKTHLEEIDLKEICMQDHLLTPIGSFGSPTPNPHMFIPPCYQPHIVQAILEPLTKLPYMKLHYLTYVKDIDLDYCDLSPGLTTKARACKGAGQK
jgi:hypothetical protein